MEGSLLYKLVLCKQIYLIFLPAYRCDVLVYDSVGLLEPCVSGMAANPTHWFAAVCFCVSVLLAQFGERQRTEFSIVAEQSNITTRFDT